MSTEASPQPHRPGLPGPSRNTLIVGGVVLFHVAALWALQVGLVRRAVEVFVPIEVMAELVTPPTPKVEPAPKAPAPPPVPQPLVKRTPPPPPQPVAIADPTPAPNAPTGVVAPQPPAPPQPVVAAAPVSPPPAPPAPPRIEQPVSDLAYLQNPAPVYPPLSKRRNEQGKVMVRVMVNADGTPQQPMLLKSSGYDLLDAAALAAVAKWRFVPGKRGGVPEPMWAEFPVIFELSKG